MIVLVKVDLYEVTPAILHFRIIDSIFACEHLGTILYHTYVAISVIL